MDYVKQYDILRYVNDEKGELYINLNDIVKLIEDRKPKMTQLLVEHATMDKFIGLMRKYETAIQSLP
ncbi:MAG TPA: hypothetical protein VEB42_02890 [Chitinophagaceae bacterium]|nr:hypothetical protein [Chitinophagaceae bacterium]